MFLIIINGFRIFHVLYATQSHFFSKKGRLYKLDKWNEMRLF